MNDRLETQLKKIAPIFYRECKMDVYQSCLGRGFECGDGWYIPIEQFSIKMEQLNHEIKKHKHRIVCKQFKEKYGEVACYTSIEKNRPIDIIPTIRRYKHYYRYSDYKISKIHKIIGRVLYNSCIYPVNIIIKLINYLVDMYCSNHIKNLNDQTFGYFYNTKKELIDELTNKCYNICEVCGSTEDIITTSGWIRRVCQKHK